MNELESQLRDALDETAARVPVSENGWLRNEQLLHEQPRRRSRTTWLVMATAACVAGVLVAIALLVFPGGPERTPAGPVPATSATSAPTSPPPTPTSPGPSTSPSSAPTQARTLPPNTVSVGGARLTLPSGWVAEALPRTDLSGPIMPTWCLMSNAGPVPAMQDSATCTIAFSAAETGSATPQISVDTPGGLVSNPEYCGVGGGATTDLLDYSDTYIGTRPADQRRWLFICKDGSQVSIEQYVADNAPGYVLFSSHATAEVHGIMADIAKTAELPEISAPLRLSDFGIVRSVEPTAGGYHVLVDRVVQGVGGIINNNPQTYPYDVPAALLGGQAPKVGSLIGLTTNGAVVTGIV